MKAGPWFASMKTCSRCGTKAGAMPLSVRQWTCGAGHDRDINAALNIRRQGILELKAAGLSVSACGGLRKPGPPPAVAWQAGSPALQGGEQSRRPMRQGFSNRCLIFWAQETGCDRSGRSERRCAHRLWLLTAEPPVRMSRRILR